jgi:predicted lipid-binding transport protein (Tim44 family)
VAEGLVDRIGDEIDRRIDARIGEQSRPSRPAPGGNHAPPAYAGPVAPTPSMPAAVPPPPPVPRRTSGLSGMVLGLGSMGLGVGATAVVVSNHVESVVALLMVLLIWAAIAGINVAHAQRRL